MLPLSYRGATAVSNTMQHAVLGTATLQVVNIKVTLLTVGLSFVNKFACVCVLVCLQQLPTGSCAHVEPAAHRASRQAPSLFAMKHTCFTFAFQT